MVVFARTTAAQHQSNGGRNPPARRRRRREIDASGHRPSRGAVTVRCAACVGWGALEWGWPLVWWPPTTPGGEPQGGVDIPRGCRHIQTASGSPGGPVWPQGKLRWWRPGDSRWHRPLMALVQSGSASLAGDTGFLGMVGSVRCDTPSKGSIRDGTVLRNHELKRTGETRLGRERASFFGDIVVKEHSPRLQKTPKWHCY